MNKKLFESTEFYHKRYQNFSTIIILPIFFLFLFLVIFSMFAKKEITIKSTGEIVPTHIIGKIQSTSNQTIIENNLENNKEIKKGEVLISYDNQIDTTTLNTMNEQFNLAKRKQEMIQLLINSINNSTNEFLKEDEFGYAQIATDYLARIQALKISNNQKIIDEEEQNATNAQIRQTIDVQINNNQQKINEYIEIQNAIQNENEQLTSDNEFRATFNLYQTQVNENKEQKEVLKQQFINEIQTAIEQLKNTIASYSVQKSGYSSTQKNLTTLEQDLQSLKAEQLLNASKEWSAIKQEIADLSLKINLQIKQNKDSFVIAEQSGILAINEEFQGQKQIAQGSVLAQIYPFIHSDDKIKITTYVSTSQITELKEKQDASFQIYENIVKPLILQGKIVQIDQTATKTAEGNFYKIDIETKVNKKDSSRIRYGLQGKIVMITGKKTFFNYYKDKLLE
ncbi:MAG: bacteriocin secretion accessory protein [Streptococcaceae bacterium]|nr:bacteriocin secretion accessory protein [Streptococcaceae bacterium]